MPNLATDAIEEKRAVWEAHDLDAALRLFLARWTIPDSEDSRIARDFEADLINIVQRIYREAQAPYVKAMADDERVAAFEWLRVKFRDTWPNSNY